MLNIEAKIDALLKDQLTASKYLPFFDKDIKKKCIEKSELFAQTLIHDEDAEVRQLCAAHYEFLALRLIADEDLTVRMTCAEKWESCARHLYQDNNANVRESCLNWESCHPLILMNNEEDEPIILQTVALIGLDSDIPEEKEKAREILEYEISNDEEFADTCLELSDKWIKEKCAENWRSCALKLVHSKDDDLVEISIQRLLDENDWYCLDHEELEDLCRIDERLAEAILDDHLDNWWVKSACVQLYESCAIRLLTDEDEAIAEHAQFMILESQNTKLKLNALKESNNYHIAAILIKDHDPEVRKACVRVDEDFAKALVNDYDMNVRLACLEYEECVEDLLHDEEVEIRKACAQYYSGAIQLIKDEDPEVRKVCAEHYQCALGLMNDVDEGVRTVAKETVEGNTNLKLDFD
ncbi:hypothetical protein [Acinetobacter sp. YH12108]|uniref:hypothetical protein n=1 Tax=Acinetobacter sp. YH12108 TaxID=2601095 RepID=UPI0015D20E5C|nr:hypothetical protein [Acinetobacter sp. YH12108]